MKDLGPIVVTLLSGGLIAGIVGLLGHFVTLWNTQRQMRGQRAREELHAQQDALQKYLDQMSELLLNENLRPPEPAYFKPEGLQKYLDQARNLLTNLNLRSESENSEPKDYVINLAQARTLAILAGVGPSLKRVPITLVYELGLIQKDEPVLYLRNAGLDGAKLSELTLREANLTGVDLRVSDLNGADLQGSDLSLADLRGSDLRRAHLSNVDLTGANLLPYDGRDPERWSPRNLERIHSRTVSLSATRPLVIRAGRSAISKLTITSLREAILTDACLRHAWLSGADLTGADLTGADLTGADLTGADLSKAEGITSEQLHACRSLEDATMPNGQKYEDWLKSKGRGEDGENSAPS